MPSGLTYGDRSNLMKALKQIDSQDPSNDTTLVSDVTNWLHQVEKTGGVAHSLVQDSLFLASILLRPETAETKTLARKALVFALRSPPFGLPAAHAISFIWRFVVNEIQQQNGESADFQPSSLLDEERLAAEDYLLQLAEQPGESDDVIVEQTHDFIELHMPLRGPGFLGHLLRNAEVLLNLLIDPLTPLEHRGWARAALAYLVLQDDVIDDRLGIFGLVDDAFVLQTAVDLVAPSCIPWLDILDLVIEKAPFLRGLHFSWEGDTCSLSEYALLNAALACPQMRGVPVGGRTAVVVPRAGLTPALTGFIAALSLIFEFVQDEAQEPIFQVGEKVLVDNEKVQIFEGYEIFHGEELFRLRSSYIDKGKQASQSFLLPMSEIRRLSKVSQKRKVRGRITSDRTSSCSPISALERVFHLDWPAQIESFDSSVVLVAPRWQTDALLSKIRLFGEVLHDVIPTGVVGPGPKYEVKLLSSSRRSANRPILLLAADLDTAVEYIEAEDLKVSTAIVDISSRNSGRSASMRNLSDSVDPLAFVRNYDERSLRLLGDLEFAVWDWLDEDARQALLPTKSQARLHPIVRHESEVRRQIHRDIAEERLPLPEAEHVHSILTQLRQLRAARGDDELVELNDAISYSGEVLCRVLQLLAPLSEMPGTHDQLMAKIESVQGLLAGSGFMTATEKECISRLSSGLVTLVSRLRNQNPKTDSLRAVLSRAPDTAIFVRTAEQRDFLSDWLSVPRQQFWTPTVNPERVSLQRSVFGGWYGASLMGRFIFPPFTEELMLLLYDVEYKWFSRKKKRLSKIRYERQKTLHMRHFFADVSSWPKRRPITRNVHAVSAPEGDDEAPDSQPEPDDLHVDQLRTRRIAAMRAAGGDQRESEVKAVPVYFTNDMCAFLTPKYKAKCVSHLFEAGECMEIDDAIVVEKIPEDLSPDDVLVFLRGSGTDAIREFADRLLPRGRREMAKTWQRALRRYKEKNNLTKAELTRRLKAAGCTHRYEVVSTWLHDDDMTAPRHAHTHELEIIAKATQDPELLANLSDCAESISDVWGSHLKASHQLAKKVLDRINDLLQEGFQIEDVIELEEDVVLLRVEAVDETIVKVPAAMTNRLIEYQ